MNILSVYTDCNLLMSGCNWSLVKVLQRWRNVELTFNNNHLHWASSHLTCLQQHDIYTNLYYLQSLQFKITHNSFLAMSRSIFWYFNFRLQTLLTTYYVHFWMRITAKNFLQVIKINKNQKQCTFMKCKIRVFTLGKSWISIWFSVWSMMIILDFLSQVGIFNFHINLSFILEWCMSNCIIIMVAGTTTSVAAEAVSEATEAGREDTDDDLHSTTESQEEMNNNWWKKNFMNQSSN